MKTLLWLVFIGIIVLYSCSSHLSQQVDGHWVVDRVIWQKREYPNYSFLVNMLYFSRKGYCKVPIQKLGQTEGGTWSVIDSDKNLISINTANEMFAGTYNVTVYPTHDTTPEQMVLQSEHTTIYCSLVWP